jgi:hypothetical protein
MSSYEERMENRPQKVTTKTNAGKGLLPLNQRLNPIQQSKRQTRIFRRKGQPKKEFRSFRLLPTVKSPVDPARMTFVQQIMHALKTRERRKLEIKSPLIPEPIIPPSTPNTKNK